MAQNQTEDALERCKQGMKICKHALENGSTKDDLAQLYCDLMKQALELYSELKLTLDQNIIASSYVQFTEKAFGEKSNEKALALYQLSRAKFALEEKDQALELIREATRIKRGKVLTQTKKDVQTAQMYLWKATILEKSMFKPREALKCYKQALEIIRQVESWPSAEAYKNNILNQSVQLVELISQTDPGFDYEALSEEEDYSVMDFES